MNFNDREASFTNVDSNMALVECRLAEVNRGLPHFVWCPCQLSGSMRSATILRVNSAIERPFDRLQSADLISAGRYFTGILLGPYGVQHFTHSKFHHHTK